MVELVPFLSTILPIIASSLLIVVVSINLYFKIRRKFPISVNCWFCNSWTKVHYDDRNSFDCPTCSQYNGFTKDGDYNKIIPEQHDELMNKSSRMKSSKSGVTNGLCALCNNNQQLKIFQLAHFVPMIEDNYDVEIEHFQKQLEKAYKLCKKCDRVLKKTIETQNAWIFANKIKNLCSNGISKVAQQIRNETRLSLLGKINGIITIFLVLLVILTTVASIKVFTKNLSVWVPPPYLQLYKTIVSIANSSRLVHLPFVTRSVKIEPYTVACTIGLAYQIIRISWARNITANKVNQLLCWVILVLISWVRPNRQYSTYILLIEGFSCIFLLSTAFSHTDNKPPVYKNPGKMRKIVKNLEYTCTDMSSDFENISSETDSDYLNKSTYSSLDVPLQQTATTVLNSSFQSAKTSPSNCYAELNKSLNNLHLGFKSPRTASSVASFPLKRPKPVLSPPKFQNVNSWVAGGFWRDQDGIIMPMAQRTNLSRSSSESSGFGSQHNEPFVPLNFDKVPNFEFTRLSPTPSDVRRGNPFYPNLQHNNMLLIQRVGSPTLVKYNESRKGLFENWSDKINSQATQSFKDLSLRSNN